MSENIRGITFAEQAVTPADDAIVRRAILGDGVLTGCEVTYSGSTLTLASGYIIACGRSFQITTAQNFAVVDATSGVARLLLTIDLTQTATEETFNQISFSIEYAAAEDGFVDLIQDDINLSGIKYQIVCAVVSLGTGGITGIVSKLERTEGGGGLNFKVVPGLTQPGTASENTIWVKTERIGAWYFSATQPEGMQEWDVWFEIGTESAVEFNALRKNGLQVYPLSAKQMVSGALVDVTAKRYQGGKWAGLVVAPIDGLIAEYTFNELLGNAIPDTSPNGYNLTATNVTQENGVIEKAGYFAGNSSAVANVRIVPDGMNGFSGLTISFWIKTQMSNGYGTVMNQDNYYSGVSVQYEGAEERLFVSTGVDNGGIYIGTGELADGKWHHVCLVYDYSNSVLQTWIDGQKRETTSCGKFTTSSGNFTIGCYAMSSVYYYIGSLDQIRFYNRALSDEEVATLWNGGAGC